MALYLISYDISMKHPDEYEPVWTLLKQWKAVKVLYSQWVVPADPGSAMTIAEALEKLFKAGDHLLVSEITTDCAWTNLLISTDDFSSLISRYARR